VRHLLAIVHVEARLASGFRAVFQGAWDAAAERARAAAAAGVTPEEARAAQEALDRAVGSSKR
jgi:hypothetical protein